MKKENDMMQSVAEVLEELGSVEIGRYKNQAKFDIAYNSLVELVMEAYGHLCYDNLPKYIVVDGEIIMTLGKDVYEYLKQRLWEGD